MLFMEMIQLLELLDQVEPDKLIKACSRVFDKYDLPERVEDDTRHNVGRVEAFTRALLIELLEGEEK